MGFAATERSRLRLEAACCINEWLKTDPDLSLNVPIKERSLEIFRDEKRLDRLRAGSDCLLRRFSLSSSQRIPGIRVHGLVLDDADVH